MVEDLHSLLMDDPFTIFILNRTVRVNVSLVTGREEKIARDFSNKGGTTSNRPFWMLVFFYF